MMPNRSPQHIAQLHKRLRAFLIEAMPFEAPDAIACALLYEVTSITATMAETEAQARGLLQDWVPIALQQVRRYGIGRPHP